MSRHKDHSGLLYGRLTLIKRVPAPAGKLQRHIYYLAWCTCGTEKVMRLDSLVDGRVTSCGCHQTLHRITHGGSQTSEYKSYQAMINRCYNGRVPAYKYYGAKGVTVCTRWIGSFADFLADMGPKPGPEYSLDRIDPFGNYEPGNCRWSDPETQQANKRSKYEAVSQWRPIDIPVEF